MRFSISTVACLLMLPLFKSCLEAVLLQCHRCGFLVIFRRHSLTETSWCSGSSNLSSSFSKMFPEPWVYSCFVDVSSGVDQPNYIL